MSEIGLRLFGVDAEARGAKGGKGGQEGDKKWRHDAGGLGDPILQLSAE